MKKTRFYLLPVLLLLIFMTGCAKSSSTGGVDAADTILTNGYIYTVDTKASKAEAIAIKDGKITFVGTAADAEKYKGSSTKEVDLKGKFVLPSFFEGHGHASAETQLLYSCDLSEGKTLEDYLSILEKYMKANPDATSIKGSGWSDTVFGAEGPGKDALDALCKKLGMDVPIALYDSGHHSLWVNSNALSLGNITKDTPNPSANSIIQHDATTGEPSGVLREGAADLVENQLPDYTESQYEAGILAYQEQAHALGVTGVLDPLLPADGNAIEAYKSLEKKGKLTMRIRGAYATNAGEDFAAQLKTIETARKKDNSGSLFQMTTVKFFIDGVIESATAYLNEPYAKDAGKGDSYTSEPLWPQSDLNDDFAALEKTGLQIHVHAIGDAAVHEALDAFEYAQSQNGTADYRNAITHLQLVENSDYSRFKTLGVIPVVNPYWAEKDDYYYNLQVPFLGEARAQQEYPVQSFIKNGAMIVSASDFPVTNPADPLTAIEIGVTRSTPDILLDSVTSDAGDPKFKLPLWPEEAASLKDMIASATYNGAYANFLEDACGSIEVGKSADLIVLDQNLFEINSSDISKTKVELTMFEGQTVYRAEK